MTPLEPLTLAPAAFLAGVLMFLAPCTLPIIPGYLIFIAGVPAGGEKVTSAVRKRRILLNAIAFVIGFSVVFVLLGTFAALIGAGLGGAREFIARGAGFIIILFGLMMLNIIRLPVLGKEWHMKIPSMLKVGSWESSLCIGALFALGWSPCVGPILGTVLLFASSSATVLQGAVLLSIFSLGLALPFILAALLIDTAAAQFAKWGKVTNTLSILGGLLLVVLGVLMLAGVMGSTVAWSSSLFDWLGYNKLYNYL